jgi:hypothetical protein
MDLGGWEDFFSSPNLGNLTRLTISRTIDGLPPEGIAALVRAPWLRKLRVLHVIDGTGTATNVQPLFAQLGEGATTLSELRLSAAKGLGAKLARWPGLSALLDLSFASFGFEAGDEGKALLRSSFLSCRLNRLDLTGACGTLKGAQALANCPALKGLRWLGFGYNDLTPENMTLLLASPHLRHLEALHLGSEHGQDIDLEGAQSEAALILLAESKNFPRLRDVVVGSETPGGAIDALRKRFGPRLRVWCDC